MSKGMYTTEQLLDSLLENLNVLPRLLIDNQFVAFCSNVSDMAQKIVLVKKGIRADMDNREKTIEVLKDELRRRGADVQDMTPEEFVKGGEADGEN